MTNDEIAGVDLGRLHEWMDERSLGSGELTNVTPLTVGTQNILVRFQRSGRDYVLRRPPVHKRSNSDKTMRREARVLAALAGSDVPHPGFIAGEPETEVLGASFYLMEPVDGFNASVELPELHRNDPAIQREMGFAFVDGAAALASVDHIAAGLDDFGRAEGYLDRQVDRWRSQLDGYAELSADWRLDIPGLDDVARWIEANQPSESVAGIVHGDFHAANVMFQHDSPQLAAIVDWELSTIGDPMMDLGLIIAFRTLIESGGDIPSLAGFPATHELIDRYHQRSGRDTSSAMWFGVLSCYKTGILVEGTHARSLAGKVPLDVGQDFHKTAQRLFATATDIIAKA